MSTDEKVSVKPGVHGQITKPGRSGIMGLSPGVSVAGVPFIIILILMLTKQWFIPAAVIAVLGIIAAALLILTRKEGRSIYGRIMLKRMQKRKEKTGKHVYVSGPTGRGRDGTARLPGLLAGAELFEYLDPYGRPFGLIRMKGRGVKNYSVVIEAHPVGDELVDTERVNSMVGHWGAWLAQRGIDEGIRGAQVVVESSPDTGLRLRKHMEAHQNPAGSAFSRAVSDAIVSEYQGGSPVLSTRITVTFDGKSLDGTGKDRGPDEMAEEIGNRLPYLLGGLADTGAGTSVRPCTAQEIVDHTRGEYDPTMAAQIEEARSEGGTGLRWVDAGPSFALDAFDHYRHDRAYSKSWTMYEGPRGMFYATALRRILEPANNVLSKRVTMLYRPIPAADATDLVERDINDASFAASQKARPSARARQRYAAAQKSAEEEAQGAGLTRFGIIVTASVEDPEKFKQLDKQIPAALNQARLRLRTALGNQAVTFQAGLPLGLVLPDHMVLPDEVRDWF